MKRVNLSRIIRFIIDSLTTFEIQIPIIGKLNKSRAKFGAIWVNSQLLVVGGTGSQKTEACQLNNGIFTCTDYTAPPLTNYQTYPLLHIVEDDYAQCQ